MTQLDRTKTITFIILAGFIYPIAGSIMTMPGLPGAPRELDIDKDGNILGDLTA